MKNEELKIDRISGKLCILVGSNLMSSVFKIRGGLYLKVLLLLVFLSFSTLSLAQDWELVRSFPVPRIHKFQVDRYGSLFVADRNGNIFKLDSLGNTLETYSPIGGALPSDLQVSQSVNVFVFYEDWQKFVLLDRFLGNARTYDFSDSEDIGYVKSACWASDGNVWLFDQSDFSLKKYNPTTKSILLSLPFNFSLDNEELEITQLREHEGKIIGVSENKIFVFSFTGNLEWSFDIENISEIGFKEKSVFWIGDEQSIHFWNFFKNETNAIQVPAQFEKLAIYGRTWIAYFSGTIYSYK
jgi:hypothetical protein